MAFNAPIFLARRDLVETAWALLKPGGRMAVAGARCTTGVGKIASPLIRLMLGWAGHPHDFDCWTVHEPWAYLRQLAAGSLHVQTTLGFWYLLWAEKPQ